VYCAATVFSKTFASETSLKTGLPLSAALHGGEFMKALA
jgi:hypothetical protein